jgi:peptidoglycan hydrolase CwlO-like protein
MGTKKPEGVVMCMRCPIYDPEKEIEELKEEIEELNRIISTRDVWVERLQNDIVKLKLKLKESTKKGCVCKQKS